MKRMMNKRLNAIAALVATLGLMSFANAQAQEFKGYSLKVKLIGGTQYEQLYAAVIPEWEKKTGGKVEILSRKNHFELDKEIKQDIAAKNIDYCVASNHTSFAPQYGQIYRDLRLELPSSHLNKFGKLVLDHSTVAGSLVQLPRHSDISQLYYNKKFYDSAENKAAYKAKFGKELAVPATWTEFAQQAKFFSKPLKSLAHSFPAKMKRSVDAFMKCWWLKVAKCSTRTGSPHSIQPLAKEL